MRSPLPPTHVATLISTTSATARARLAALFLFSVAVLLVVGAAAVRGQSALDGFDPKANGTVYVVVVQTDGKILIGGDFTTLAPNGSAEVTRNHIARLNPDGGLDDGFNPNANDIVRSMAVHPDGRVLVGGNFTSIGGQTRNHIARLDPTTGLPDSFDPNASGSGQSVAVRAIAIQPDGKILAGGDYQGIGGQARNHIARLNPTTALADSFDPNANGIVDSILVQSDGKILAGGYFTNIGGYTRNHIARLDPTTGLADSFDASANGNVYSIAAQADGKILVGGEFSGANSIGGQARNHIARLNPTTGLADGFDPSVTGTLGVLSVAIQPDGKILIGGDFTTIGGQPRNHLGRLDSITGVADSFNPNPNDSVWSIAPQSDGKILAGGQFITVGGGAGNRIVRLESNGTVDRTLNLNAAGGGYVGATALQPDGKILIGGWFTSILGVQRNYAARLNSDGTLDMGFDPNANFLVFSITPLSDGRILAVGSFTTIGGQIRNRIARLEPNSGSADSFDPNADRVIDVSALQPDGKILVGGEFTTIGGQTRNYFARLDPMSGLADSFNPNPNGYVNSIAVQTDGKILVAGGFDHIGGQARAGIARLDPTSGAPDSFNPGTDDLVTAIVVQEDGKILVGGFFNRIGGQNRSSIARLDPNTGLAEPFSVAIDRGIWSLGTAKNGKILIGGEFTSVNFKPHNFIARLNSDSTVDDTFHANADDDVVYSIALQSDGKILAGGRFTSFDGENRNYFVRLSNDNAALQDLIVTPSVISWVRSGESTVLQRVTFEHSIDNVSFTPLGNGTAVSGNWTLTGLSLPRAENLYIRARGYYLGGQFTDSESITESVRNAFLAQPIGTPSPTPTPRPATLANISTRLQVGTSDRVMIAGFIVQGSAPKRVLIRAAGPSLANFGVPNAMVNPRLELHDTGTIGTNDDWQTTQIGGVITSDQVAQIQSSGLAPSDPRESAIIASLSPGSYTAIVQGVSDGTGVGIVEVYDLDATSGSILANISTRGFVQSGDNVMIGGFIVVTQPTRVIVRAIGPSLAPFGVPDALANPQLELHDASGTIGQNDDWQTTQLGGIITSDQVAEIQNSQLAPTNAAESAIIATLQPGSYTAIVRGVNDTTGNALVEVYQLSGTATPTPSPTATATSTPAATATSTPTATPTATSTPAATATPSATGSPTPTPTPTPGALFGVLSSSAMVNTGDAIMFNAFIITGPDPKQVILRGLGPSLPVSSPLQNPTLELRDSNGALLIANNDWQDDPTQAAIISAAGLAPANPLESGIAAILPAGSYTSVLRGLNNGTGRGIGDLHDISPGTSSRLTAIGTRGFVMTGADVLTSGIVMTQGGLGDVLIRVLGPSLAQAGISNVLADPTLELRDVNGALLHANNNWQDDFKQAMFIQATGLAPTNPLESAIFTSLQPGTYTVLAAGLNSTTGIGYIQLYSLPHSGPALQLTP